MAVEQVESGADEQEYKPGLESGEEPAAVEVESGYDPEEVDSSTDSLDAILSRSAKPEDEETAPKKKSVDEEILTADAETADAEEEAEEVDEEEEAEEPELSAKASKRFQTLSARAKAAEERAREYEGRLEQSARASQEQAQQYRQYSGQLYAQTQQMQAQQQQQLQDMQRQMQESYERKRFEEMSPEEQFRHKIVQDQQSQLQKAIQEAVTPLQQQLKAQEDSRQAAVAAMRKQQQFAQWADQTKKVASRLLAEFDDDALTALGPEMEEVVVNFAAGYELDSPAQAEDKVKRFLDRYFSARLKSSASKAKAIRDKNNSAPQAGGRKGAVEGKRETGFPKHPGKGVLENAGYSGSGAYFDWMHAGFPRDAKGNPR